MPKYQTTASLPPEVTDFFTQLVGMAHVESFDVGPLLSGPITISFEADDEYELAEMVRECREDLKSIGYHDIEIPRPILVGTSVEV